MSRAPSRGMTFLEVLVVLLVCAAIVAVVALILQPQKTMPIPQLTNPPASQPA